MKKRPEKLTLGIVNIDCDGVKYRKKDRWNVVRHVSTEGNGSWCVIEKELMSEENDTFPKTKTYVFIKRLEEVILSGKIWLTLKIYQCQNNSLNLCLFTSFFAFFWRLYSWVAFPDHQTMFLTLLLIRNISARWLVII